MLNTIDIGWMTARESLIGITIHGSFTFQQHHEAIRDAIALFPPDSSIVDILADYSNAASYQQGLLNAIFETIPYMSQRLGCMIVVGAPVLVREAFAMAMRLEPCMKQRIILADTAAEALFLLDAARHNRQTHVIPC